MYSLFSGKNKGLIPGPMQLFREAFDLYRKQFGRLMMLLLVAIVAVIFGIFTLLGILSLTSLMASSATSSVRYVGLVLSIIIEVSALVLLGVMQLWASLTIILTLVNGTHEGETIRNSYRSSLRFVLPYLWVSILASLLTLGGVLLLFIPGIILSVWFSLTIFLVVFENRRGVTALIASREYVRGRWWPIALRIAALALLTFVVALPGAVLTSVFNQKGLAQSLNFFLQLLLTPLIFGYFYALYLHVRTLPVTAAPEANLQLRKYFITGSIIMAFVSVGLVISVFVFGFAAL